MTSRRNDPETIREEGTNVLLAQALRARGLQARAARRTRSGAPDTLLLSEAQLRGLADQLDALADSEFKRLPSMAHCEARRALNEGLSKILGLPDLTTLRTLIATEPVVSNRRL